MTFPVLLCLVLASILQACETSLVKLLQVVINNISEPKWLFVYVGASIVTILIYCIYAKYKATISERMACKGKLLLHKKVLKIKTEKVQEIQIGKLTTAINSLSGITNAVINIPLFIVRSGIALAVSMLYMFRQNFILSVITICEVIPIGIALYTFSKKIDPVSEKRRDLSCELSNIIQRLQNINLIHSFSKEKYEEDKFNTGNNEYCKINLKKNKLDVSFSMISKISYRILDVTLVIYYFISYIQTGKIDIAELLLFASLQNNFVEPFKSADDLISTIVDLNTNIDKNNEIMNEEEEVDGDITLNSFTNGITFENVGFKYKDSDDILQNVNMFIPKGKHVGIYGESGAGKSTLINLILRFFKVSEGRILIDGIPINELTQVSLRKHVGVVSQDIEIFSDMTIKENIVYGLTGSFTDENVEEAARKANAHEFISKLPMAITAM
jgi:ABC-type multidrug transport system fused ATPase/permease subunit